MTQTEHSLTTIEAFNEAFNLHDINAVMKLTTEDIVFSNTSGGCLEGKDAVRAVLTRLRVDVEGLFRY